MRRFLLPLLLCAVAVPPAAAQLELFVDKDARSLAQGNAAKIENVTAIVRDLSEKHNQLRKQLTAVSRQQQELDAKLRDLAGGLEEAQYAAAQERDGVNSFIPELTEKITALERQLAALSDQIANMEQFITLPPEQDLYNAAFDKLQSQQYAEAIAEFGRLVDFYPQGQFSANARYWISKAHLALSDYEQAVAAAEALMAAHPDNDRQAETMLVIAEAMRGLGREEEARAQLRALLDAFPTSLAADEARQMLAR